MKYLILSLSMLSFAISSMLFVKEFDIAEFKSDLKHSGFFKDVGDSFTHEGKEELVCYRQTHRNLYLLLLTISISSLGFIYYAFEQKKQLSKKLTETNIEVIKQNELIENINTEMLDGINYAKHLQRAMLSNTSVLKEYFKNYIILNRPKNIVSGDFYWVEKVDDYIFIAVADCTGHGVPGAFMTILGTSLLNQIVIENKIFSTSQILSTFNEKLLNSLVTEVENQKVNDGMDIALLRYDCNKSELMFSGAKRNMLLLSENDCKEIKGARQSIGEAKFLSIPFNEEIIKMNSSERVFIFTDGLTDQLGGENYKKFMSKNFKELLNSSKHLELSEQRIVIKNTISKWIGTNIQTDDILLLGFEV